MYHVRTILLNPFAAHISKGVLQSQEEGSVFIINRIDKVFMDEADGGDILRRCNELGGIGRHPVFDLPFITVRQFLFQFLVVVHRHPPL